MVLEDAWKYRHRANATNGKTRRDATQIAGCGTQDQRVLENSLVEEVDGEWLTDKE
jgi:hypothetical protein